MNSQIDLNPARPPNPARPQPKRKGVVHSAGCPVCLIDSNLASKVRIAVAVLASKGHRGPADGSDRSAVKIVRVKADPPSRQRYGVPHSEYLTLSQPHRYLSISGLREWTLICNSYPNIRNTTTHLASRSRQFFLLGCSSSPRNTAHSVRRYMYLYHGESCMGVPFLQLLAQSDCGAASC